MFDLINEDINIVDTGMIKNGLFINTRDLEIVVSKLGRCKPNELIASMYYIKVDTKHSKRNVCYKLDDNMGNSCILNRIDLIATLYILKNGYRSSDIKIVGEDKKYKLRFYKAKDKIYIANTQKDGCIGECSINAIHLINSSLENCKIIKDDYRTVYFIEKDSIGSDVTYEVAKDKKMVNALGESNIIWCHTKEDWHNLLSIIK